MKECELCNCRAKMYCESDQASLCCGCDAKVHSANFLVARHTRTLLCHTCQSPTPWKASGPSFGPTVSVCNRCCVQRPEMQHHQQQEEEEEEEGDGENEEEEEEEDDDVEDEDENEDIDEEEEDGENQVVPWSATPPPLPSSSSSEGEEDSASSVGRSTDHSSKRTRENANLSYQDDLGCTSPTTRRREDEEEEEEETTSSIGRFRPLKRKGTVGSDSRSALIDSLHRFHKVRGGADDGDVIEISKLSGEGRAVDLVDTDSPSPLI